MFQRNKKKKELEIHPTVICVFEDDSIESFEPLHHFHPVWELMFGATSLGEKIFRSFPKLTPMASCREELEYTLALPEELPLNELPAGDYVFVNARVAEPEKLASIIEAKGPPKIYTQENPIIAARIRLTENLEGDVFSTLEAQREQLTAEDVGVTLFSYLFELMEHNGDAIKKDAPLFPLGKREGAIYATTVLVNPKQVYLAKTSSAGPGVVIDASEGPVIIDEDVEIMANSFIKGPAYIGEHAIIKAGAIIYGETSIGHTCKIGGEVGESIILPFTNKQHYGNIAHSYIGSWCNLGAGTSCSDLKNTYSTVKLSLGGKPMDTERQFLGLFMGDHVTVGINTMFNTGAIVGSVSNVYGADFQSKYLPPFSWSNTSKKLEIYKIEKALQTIQRMMKRRQYECTEEYQEYVKTLFKKEVSRRR